MAKKRKKPKFENLEEWENAKGLKTVDPKEVSKAILAEYDNSQNES